MGPTKGLEAQLQKRSYQRAAKEVSTVIGWIQLSRKAVAAAEQALSTDQLGVRDEIGFLALHQAFSDRFFPGTSVLHTRLRYALFVPWLMRRSDGDPKRFTRDQLTLTAQLVRWEQEARAKDPKLPGQGIIGGTLKGREPNQTAAMMYWSALTRWGLLQPRIDGTSPSRAQVLQRYRAMASGPRLAHIDGEPVDLEDLDPFVRLPAEPDDLLRVGRPLSFLLSPEESQFMRRQLQAVLRDDGKPSLLARLAQHSTLVASASRPWSKPVADIADSEDRRYLQLARRTAALAGIGRAVYAALVEAAKNLDLGVADRSFRDDLSRMRLEHEDDAIKLDIGALIAVFPAQRPAELLGVLAETQAWLRAGKADCRPLESIYRAAETKRKSLRARLGPSLSARQRRAEWHSSPQTRHPLAEPLHYRWANVRTQLNDLGPL